MANFQTHQEKAIKLNPKRTSKTFFKYVKTLENEFINLNIEQLENSEDSKGKLLKNKNKKFKGVYTERTEEIAKIENPLAEKKVKCLDPKDGIPNPHGLDHKAFVICAKKIQQLIEEQIFQPKVELS